MRAPIALLGNYGHRNLGDEAILRGFVDATRRTRPDLLPLLIYSDDPNDTATRFDSSAVRPQRFRRSLAGKWWRFPALLLDVVRSLRRCRHLVLAGGGLINDSNPTSLLLYGTIAVLGPLFGTQVHAAAISVGPLDARWSRLLARAMLGRLRSVSVRDSDSASIVRSLGIDHVAWAPDAALAMDGFSNCAGNGDEGQGGTVAVSVVPLGKPGAWYARNESGYARYLRTMADVLTSLVRDHGLRIALVPINEVHDARAIGDVLSLLPERERAFCEAICARTVDDVLAALARSEVVLACRLHSAVLATLARRPFVTLAYQRKVSGYAIDVGMGDAVLDPSDVTAPEVVALATAWLSDRKRHSATVGRYAEVGRREFDARWRATLDELAPPASSRAHDRSVLDAR